MTAMRDDQTLIEIERRLWTNDAAFYQENLAEDALLVFAETGPISRSVAVDAIRRENVENRRWAEVQFDDVRTLRISAESIVLYYRVTSRWAHESEARHAHASSVYVRRGDGWKLVFHQQTPIGGFAA